MDKREHENLWIRNNARMLTKLRAERRQNEAAILEQHIHIRWNRAELVKCGSVPMREMLIGRIANRRKWIREYQAANVRASRAIAILSDSLKG